MGTPRSIDVLTRGVASKRPALRRACEDALLAIRQEPKEEAS